MVVTGSRCPQQPQTSSSRFGMLRGDPSPSVRGLRSQYHPRLLRSISRFIALDRHFLMYSRLYRRLLETPFVGISTGVAFSACSCTIPPLSSSWEARLLPACRTGRDAQACAILAPRDASAGLRASHDHGVMQPGTPVPANKRHSYLTNC